MLQSLWGLSYTYGPVWGLSYIYGPLWGLSYTYGPLWDLSYTYDGPLWGLSYTYGPVWGLSYTHGAVYSCVWTKLRNILKQPPQVFSKKAVYENFANFCKTPVPESLFYNQACHFIKKTLWHRRLPVNFAKFLTRTFFQNTAGWLLLKHTGYILYIHAYI